jgi:hypothetical protein
MILRRFDDELAANTLPKFVFSSELLFRFGDHITRMRDHVQRYFSDIRIIAYVREPVSYSTSRVQHAVTHRRATLDELYGRTGERSLVTLEYRKNLEPYIELFGRDAVDIRIFDRKQFVGGDLMSDFCAALGEPKLAQELPNEPRNPALCYEGVLLASEYQAAMARRGEKIGDKDFKKLLSRLRDLKGVPFSLPASVAAEVQARAADDVAWLRQTLNPQVFEVPAASGGQPAWSDAVLRQASKAVRKRRGGAETDGEGKAVWLDVLDALGFGHVEGKRGRLEISRRSRGTEENAPELDAASAAGAGAAGACPHPSQRSRQMESIEEAAG